MGNSNLWIGLGIGSIAGALAYRYSRTQKAKKLKRKLCHALHSAGEQAGELYETAKEKLRNAGNEAAEKIAE